MKRNLASCALFVCLAAGSLLAQNAEPHALQLSVVDTPDPAVPGQPVTYTATIHNPGPGNALNVELWHQYASGTFRSATATQGTCERTASQPGWVICRLGTIAAGASASTSTVAIKAQPGTMQNYFSVDTTSPGPVRSAEVETVVAGNFVFDGNTSSVEPSVHTFTIQRLAGVDGPATLRLTTAGATHGLPATSGGDFAPLDIPVQFAAGEVTKTLTVTILDDSEVEANEELDLLLTNPDGSLAAMKRLSINDDADWPHIRSITPTAAAPGSLVTLRGDNFRPGFRYAIGGVTVTPVSVTPAEVVLVVPRLPQGPTFAAVFPPGVGFGPGAGLTILPSTERRRRSSRS